ncbi:MAG TPA: YncE family protein [Thermoplasmata archaeon]|nr:YncE family protein [Thermoplasmata archaeon]
MPSNFIPTETLFDPKNGYVYVLNGAVDPPAPYDNLTVINGTTLIGNLSLGSDPSSIIYDSGNGYVFVLNFDSSNVTVINGTRLMGTVRVGTYPISGGYDPANGLVYILNEGSSNVSVINGTQLSGTVPVGSGPAAMIEDAANGDVYVINSLSGSISVLNGTKNVNTIDVGRDPTQAVYDGANGEVYVSNSKSSNVSVINSTAVIGTVTVGSDPEFLTEDSSNGFIYVANVGSSSISVINGTSLAGSVNVGSEPRDPLYINRTGDVYVENLLSSNMSILDGTTLVGTLGLGDTPDAPTWVPSTGRLYVPNFCSANMTVISFKYLVTFSEVGLPNGTAWSVNLTAGPSNRTTNATLALLVVSGNYSYVATSSDKRYATPGGTVRVDQAPVRVNLTFGRVIYNVTFMESGLPAGTPWSINFSGSLIRSTGSSIRIPVANGTYLYTVGLVPGWTTANFHGRVTVQGASTGATIRWVQVNYTVTFRATGLPSAAVWWVNLTGGPSLTGNGTSLSVGEPNGSYAYSVATGNRAYWAPNGTVVVDGSSVNLSVRFAQADFGVNFMEIGLPVGTNWSVTLNGTINSSVTGTIGFQTPDGTYPYEIVPIPGWITYTWKGNVTVRGAAINLPLVFSAHESDIVVTARGLSNHTGWEATIGTTTESTRNSTVIFVEPNGTYTLSAATLVPGYRPPSPWQVRVEGTTVRTDAVFLPDVYTVTFSESGLPSGQSWSILLGVTEQAGVGNVTFTGIPNGTYNYLVGRLSGFTGSPSSGTVVVAGQNVTESVAFSSNGTGSSFLGLPLVEGYALVVGVAIGVMAVAFAAWKRGGRGGTPPG